MKLTKTIRHNQTKLQQLRRRYNKAFDNNQWALLPELENKINMVLRRLGR